jgi:transcriptional regulator with XRE-family HTH domain
MGMNEFAALVKSERERQGIRAYDLARDLKQMPSWLSRLEKGGMANPPTPEVMASLATALGLTVTVDLDRQDVSLDYRSPFDAVLG